MPTSTSSAVSHPPRLLLPDALRALQTLEALSQELPELLSCQTVFLPSLYDQAASAEHTTSSILAAIERLSLADDARLVSPPSRRICGARALR